MLTELPRRRRLALTGLVLVLATLGQRGCYARTHVPHADELVPGIVAMHMLADGRPTLDDYNRPSNRGELVISYLVLAPFAVFGVADGWLSVAVLLLTSAFVLLVWRLALRTYGEAIAGVTGILLAFAPPGLWLYTVWVNTHVVGLLLGFAAVAFGETVLTQVGAKRTLAALGSGVLAAASGWLNPATLTFALPVAAVVAVRSRREAPVAVAFVVAGCVLGVVLAGPGAAVASATLGEGVSRAFVSIPALLTRSFASSFGYGAFKAAGHVWHGWALYALMFATYPLLLVRSVKVLRRGREGAALAAVAFAQPTLFVLVMAWSGLGEAKYLLYTYPVFALGIAVAATRRPRLLATLAVAPVLLSLWANAPRVEELRDNEYPFVVKRIESLGVKHVFSNYWVKWPLIFHSDERVVAAGDWESRYPAYERQVFEAERYAVVFESGSQIETSVLGRLDEIGVVYEIEEVGNHRILWNFDRDVRCDLFDFYEANAAFFPVGLCPVD